MRKYLWYVALLLACLAAPAAADDRDEYNRRSAERFVAMFRAADVNGANAVSWEEAAGTIELMAGFDDIDITRDGIITWDELTRFIDANFR